MQDQIKWVVLKFGGTSVASRACLQQLDNIVRQTLVDDSRVWVVCSAPRGVSDYLEQIVKELDQAKAEAALEQVRGIYLDLLQDVGLDFTLITDDFAQLSQWVHGALLLQEVSPRVQAKVLASGELMLTRVVEAYLNQQQSVALWQDARDYLVASSQSSTRDACAYLAASCDMALSKERIADCYQLAADVVVTQGFIAGNEQGETVLLGRGGSDTSAAYFASLLNAERCEIWTDVPGVYSADPRVIPEARLLKQLDYDEAQEIASMGAKVLHPRCIAPVKAAAIPLHVKYTLKPTHPGTLICSTIMQEEVQIKSILTKSDVMLISIETINMWQQVGFMADVFACFKRHGISIDLLSTSESTVTVSLDGAVRHHDVAVIDKLLADLNQFARAKMIGPCASISLVGHRIREIMCRLGGVFELFAHQQIYLLSQAANNLNLTFVVDPENAQRLAKKLHTLLIETVQDSVYFDESWLETFRPAEPQADPWWVSASEPLLAQAAQQSPLYVYHTGIVQQAAKRLLSCDALDRVFYAIKANPHASILGVLYQLGYGFECVSLAEVEHVMRLLPGVDPDRILFTPNFAPREEYAQALQLGVHVTVDNLFILQQWGELFSGQPILVRVDPGYGYGHHKHVVTGGNESKFGIPISSMSDVVSCTREHKIRVVGLHAHSGSGILYDSNWQELARVLVGLLTQFPDVKAINLGGGLGIVERPGQRALDMTALNASLQVIKAAYPSVQLWMEPGRYLVAEAGVLLARVTQLKEKGRMHFVGIDTGMNSLIRPMLYGAYHPVVNLTRMGQPMSRTVNVVGPICESGDTLGYARVLPETQVGDVLLIGHAGAYGQCMSSAYNMREPAQVSILEGVFATV